MNIVMLIMKSNFILTNENNPIIAAFSTTYCLTKIQIFTLIFLTFCHVHKSDIQSNVSGAMMPKKNSLKIIFLSFFILYHFHIFI